MPESRLLCPAVKVYIKQISQLLLITGQGTDCQAGRKLQQLFHEFLCLNTVGARVAPRELRGGLTQANDNLVSHKATSSYDWLYLMVR